MTRHPFSRVMKTSCPYIRVGTAPINAVTPQIRANPTKETIRTRAGDGGFASCHSARNFSTQVSPMGSPGMALNSTIRTARKKPWTRSCGRRQPGSGQLPSVASRRLPSGRRRGDDPAELSNAVVFTQDTIVAKDETGSFEVVEQPFLRSSLMVLDAEAFAAGQSARIG